MSLNDGGAQGGGEKASNREQILHLQHLTGLEKNSPPLSIVSEWSGGKAPNQEKRTHRCIHDTKMEWEENAATFFASFLHLSSLALIYENISSSCAIIHSLIFHFKRLLNFEEKVIDIKTLNPFVFCQNLLKDCLLVTTIYCVLLICFEIKKLKDN